MDGNHLAHNGIIPINVRAKPGKNLYLYTQIYERARSPHIKHIHTLTHVHTKQCRCALFAWSTWKSPVVTKAHRHISHVLEFVYSKWQLHWFFSLFHWNEKEKLCGSQMKEPQILWVPISIAMHVWEANICCLFDISCHFKLFISRSSVIRYIYFEV